MTCEIVHIHMPDRTFTGPIERLTSALLALSVAVSRSRQRALCRAIAALLADYNVRHLKSLTSSEANLAAITPLRTWIL